MINNEIYKPTTLHDLSNDLADAIKIMTSASNKLILILRDKTDVDAGKAINSFVNSNQIAKVNLGLQLSKYLFENDINTVNDYLTKELKTGQFLLVDNAEILFDAEIAINAFTLFKNIARHQILVVVLDGRIDNKGRFIYGTSSNKDFSQYENLTDTYIIDLTRRVE